MGGKQRIRIVILLAILGIAVMAYPSLSNYINVLHSSDAVQNLTEQIGNLDSEALEAQRELAREYNEALAGSGGDGTILGSYETILDFGNGIMGSIRIPRIDVELSIYHGVSDAVLQKGVGHVPRSAFPIGGPGNHPVLTGHTGLPRAELFTGLTELEAGDRFYLNVLGEELCYQVDQISVVLPHEVEALTAVRGRDYCTLVTCTPYGINSHRLLVRGERVHLSGATSAAAETEIRDPGPGVPGELVAAGAAVIGLVILSVWVSLRKEKG